MFAHMGGKDNDTPVMRTVSGAVSRPTVFAQHGLCLAPASYQIAYPLPSVFLAVKSASKAHGVVGPGLDDLEILALYVDPVVAHGGCMGTERLGDEARNLKKDAFQRRGCDSPFTANLVWPPCRRWDRIVTLTTRHF
jgi:hypothetical protein